MLTLHETTLLKLLLKTQDIKDILNDMLFELGYIEYQRFAKYSLDNGLISSDELQTLDFNECHP